MIQVPFVFSSNGDGFLMHDRTGNAEVVERLRLVLGDFEEHVVFAETDVARRILWQQAGEAQEGCRNAIFDDWLKRSGRG